MGDPVRHNWCNKDCGMYYPVCGMVHINYPFVTWAYTNVTQNSVYLQLCLEINFNVG